MTSTIRNSLLNGGDIAIRGRADNAVGNWSSAIQIVGNEFSNQGTVGIKNAGSSWLIEGNTFENLALTNLTASIPQNIYHFILSMSYLDEQDVQIQTWNTDKKLSDHIGVCIEIG